MTRGGVSPNTFNVTQYFNNQSFVPPPDGWHYLCFLSPVTSTPTKTRSSRLPTLDRRLLAYAFAGSAAASAPTAQAAVTYSGVLNTQLTIPNPSANASVGINVDGVTGDDLTFEFDSATQSFRVTPTGSVSGGFGVYSNSTPGQATSFGFGSNIVGNPFQTGVTQLLRDYDSSPSGAFLAGPTGYIGFKNLTAGVSGYNGWVSFTLPSTTASGEALTITGWGYESALNTPVTAGQGATAPTPSSVPDAPTPAVTGLAALSLGAAGLARRRASRRLA